MRILFSYVDYSKSLSAYVCQCVYSLHNLSLFFACYMTCLFEDRWSDKELLTGVLLWSLHWVHQSNKCHHYFPVIKQVALVFSSDGWTPFKSHCKTLSKSTAATFTKILICQSNAIEWKKQPDFSINFYFLGGLTVGEWQVKNENTEKTERV